MRAPLVTAIVATYDAERFFAGCLEDLCAQTLGDRLEILVVDSSSPGGERRIAERFTGRGPLLRYYRTPFRENSHAAFNRAVVLARGRYLTTANTDDRHRPDALERMARVLDEHPEYGLVYADSLITTRANETFAQNSARLRYAWPDYTLSAALSCCLFGSQPMWRRAVHREVGLFDASLEIAADHDMFLRIARRFGAVHVAEDLGLFLKRADSNSGAAHRAAALAEVQRVLARHRRAIPLPEIFPGLDGDPRAEAAALVEMARLCALGPYTDLELALRFFERAAAAAGRAGDRAALELIRGNLAALAALAERARAGAPVAARHLPLAGLEHEVVRRSRRTRALCPQPGGGLAFGPEHEQIPWEAAYGGPDGVPLEPAAADGDGVPLEPRLRRAHGARIGRSPRPARVLFVMYGWDDAGGGTMLPRRVAPALPERGLEVAVFTAESRARPGHGPYALIERAAGGVTVFGLANRPSAFLDLQAPGREIEDPRITEAFVEVLERVRPDLVHVWNLHNLGLVLPLVAKERGLPVLFSPNNYWLLCPRLYLFHEDGRPCDGPSADGEACAACLGGAVTAGACAARAEAGRLVLARGFDRILAVSNLVARILEEAGASSVTVLQQQPPQSDRLHAAVGRRRPRPPERFGPERPLRVGFIGSLLPHKGAHVFVEALQRVAAPVEGLVAGAGAAGYAAQLRALDRHGRVRFAGRYGAAELPALLAWTDAVCVPSLWRDCAPFTCAEALAAGAPVLGAAAGGIPDFVVPGGNGLLHEPGDAAALARQIEALATEPGLLRRLSRGISVPKGFGGFLDDLLRVYAELAGSKRIRSASEPILT